MIYFLYFIHIVTCFFLILVVLLQQGRGADLSVFGGGATQSAFGARGATQLIHKLTVASFVMFVLTTVGISIFQSRTGGGSSVMEKSVVEEAEEAPAELPAEASPAPEALGVSPAETPPVEASEGPETLSFEEPGEELDDASAETPEEPQGE